MKILGFVIGVVALIAAFVMFSGSGGSDSTAENDSWICEDSTSRGVAAKELSDRLVEKGFSRAEADMQAAVSVADKC